MLRHVLRAIFFDFYGVWTPDKFAEICFSVQPSDPVIAKDLRELVGKYYLGLVDLENLVASFRIKLGNPDIDEATFRLRESDLSIDAVKFIQYLHTHFIKVGILANLGSLEHKLLSDFNMQYKLFETITDSYNLGTPLLAKEVFVKALQDIGEPRDSCMIVTGSPEYQQFAEKLGIKTLRYTGFPNLIKTIADLLKDDQSSS